MNSKVIVIVLAAVMTTGCVFRDVSQVSGTVVTGSWGKAKEIRHLITTVTELERCGSTYERMDELKVKLEEYRTEFPTYVNSQPASEYDIGLVAAFKPECSVFEDVANDMLNK